MRTRLLVVGHAFHRRTKSNEFFLALLRRSFVVEEVYVDVDEPAVLAALETRLDYEIVVLWQVDFLAPAFLALGYRTVVVPMYDASALLPMEHWIASAGASFVCFSRTLHERVTACGARSRLVRYYLPACAPAARPAFSQLDGFLWLRRPTEGINARAIARLMGHGLRSLHVHNAPDIGESSPLEAMAAPDGWPFRLTESRWSASRSAYDKALAGANVFICPRRSEGIGLSMLEALSRGQLIVAHDEPVHSEYLSSWVSGILYSVDAVQPFELPRERAAEIALAGWESAREGHRRWLEAEDDILRFVESAPAPAPAPVPDLRFVFALWSAYLLEAGRYARFLRDHVIDLDRLRANPSIPLALRREVVNGRAAKSLLTRDGLHLGSSLNSVAGSFGFGDFDAFSARPVEASCGFAVRIPGEFGAQFEVELRGCFGAANGCETMLLHANRRLAAVVRLADLDADFRIRLPLSFAVDGDLEFLLTFVPVLSSAPAVLPEIRLQGLRILDAQAS